MSKFDLVLHWAYSKSNQQNASKGLAIDIMMKEAPWFFN